LKLLLVVLAIAIAFGIVAGIAVRLLQPPSPDHVPPKSLTVE
jgi:hypothetical protein